MILYETRCREGRGDVAILRLHGARMVKIGGPNDEAFYSCHPIGAGGCIVELQHSPLPQRIAIQHHKDSLDTGRHGTHYLLSFKENTIELVADRLEFERRVATWREALQVATEESSLPFWD